MLKTLETSDGRTVFIDMNPCGDWRGFFGHEKEAEIANSLARVIIARAESNRS